MVAEAIIYSLEVLAAMFYKMKKVTLLEENEAYLQKGAKRSNKNKRRERLMAVSKMLVGEFLRTFLSFGSISGALAF